MNFTGKNDAADEFAVDRVGRLATDDLVQCAIPKGHGQAEPIWSYFMQAYPFALPKSIFNRKHNSPSYNNNNVYIS